MKKFEKFSDATIKLDGVFGGARGTVGTGEVGGTGCKIDSSGDGKIKDWEDAEWNDTTTGTNSGNCNPVGA